LSERTSAVKRGKWILDNILGTPPQPPPANVPRLEETKKVNAQTSLRERLEIHRSNAVCASCHARMDPLGLAFENFDGIGRWRDLEDGKAINAAGTLPDGKAFNGPKELVSILRTRETEFCQHLAKTMLTYALGRTLDYYDVCAVDKAVQRLSANGNRFTVLVTEICKSDPFLMRRGEAVPQ
jgi:hypothetical protein